MDHIRMRPTCFWRASAVSLLLFASPLFADVQVLKETPSTYVYPVDGHIPFNIHRGTPTLLSLMLPGSSFQEPQGVACALLKSTDDPKDPLDDVELTVLGMNSGAGEIFYNVGLRNLKKMGVRGKGVNQFQDPMGVALHPSGEVAVADTGNDRVVLLRHDGYRLAWVKALGRRGAKEGEFAAPSGVAYDSVGNLYVTDAGNHRVQVRDLKGGWRTLPIEGLEGPTALAVIDHADPWTFYTTGVYADRLVLADRKGTRLQTFALDGRLLASVSAPAGEEPYDLRYCAFDYYGHVVATDGKKNALRKFDRDLNLLAVFGEVGDGDYQFRSPRGICMNKQLGQMVVAEASCAQYMWVGSDALSLRAENGGGAVTFRFYLTEPAYLTADVKSVGDAMGTRIAENIMMDERDRALIWTPPADAPQGAYKLTLSVMATYSSRERLAKHIIFPFDYVRTEQRPSAAVPDGTQVTAAGVGMKPASDTKRTLGQALLEAKNAAGPHSTSPPTRTLGQALEAVRKGGENQSASSR